MENTANLGLFSVHKMVSEYAERSYAYMKIEEDAKRHKIGDILVWHEHFLDPYFLYKKGWIKPKTILRYRLFKMPHIC